MPRNRDFCYLSQRQRNRLVKKTCNSLTKRTFVPSQPALPEHNSLAQTNRANCDGDSFQSSNSSCSFRTSDDVSTTTYYPNGHQTCDISEDDVNDVDNYDIDGVEDGVDIGNRTCSSVNDASEIGLAVNLRHWVSKHNISQSATRELLQILKSNNRLDDFETLPNDARALMKTPRFTEGILESNGGKYVHFGLATTIKQQIDKYLVFDRKKEMRIKLNINIDGLPISKSSGGQFWPILASFVLDNVFTEPFVLGVFYGLSKPTDVNIFLRPFVEDVMAFRDCNVINNTGVIVEINCLICDAPAHAMIAGIKHHGGYFACSKCTCEGEFIENRVTYPELNCSLRTDDTFRNRSQPEHHRHESILETLGIGMVSQFPLDYMHLVLLGVTKRLLQFWIKGKHDVRLKATEIEIASNRHVAMKDALPCEFSRLPRPFTEIERWKATEFRMFLLYTGPIIMKGILHRKFYDHFLCLSTAIRILSDKEYCTILNDYANELLVYFVRKFSTLYRPEYISYNVHNLIHISADVKKYGPLDSFSAFKYESYMYTLKKKN